MAGLEIFWQSDLLGSKACKLMLISLTVLQPLMPAQKPARRQFAQTCNKSQPGMTHVSSDAQQSACVADPSESTLLYTVVSQRHKASTLNTSLFDSHLMQLVSANPLQTALHSLLNQFFLFYPECRASGC